MVVSPTEVLDFLGPQPVGILRGVGSRTLLLQERLRPRAVADLRRPSLTLLQHFLRFRKTDSCGQAGDRIEATRGWLIFLSQQMQGQAMHGADFILDCLAREGIDHLFMIPGGLIDPFLPALGRQTSLKPIVAAQEGGAAYMADGYARVTTCVAPASQ